MIGSSDGSYRSRTGSSASDRQAHPVEALADVEGGEVHVGVPGELEGHLGGVRPRRRGHADHVVDHPDRVFDRPGQQRLDLDRSGAFVGGADGQGRVGDIGQEIDREIAKGDDAEDHRRHREDEDRDRPADRKIDDLHGVNPLNGSSFSPPRHQERQENSWSEY